MTHSKKSKRGASAPLLGSKLQVKIEKLAIGGAGVARHEGLVIFVPLTAPNEEVLIEIAFVKKNFAKGRLLEILKASPSRRTPPCQVANICGGCNWQHLVESEQQKQKELLVFETLNRFLPGIPFEYLELRPSPRSLRYRNRIQPKLSHGHFGFYARESHRVVDINDCPITEQALADKIPTVRDWALSQMQEGHQEGRLEMFLTPENEVHYSFVEDPDDGIGFSQVNRFQNEDLIQTVLSWSQGIAYKNIYDLYAGAGNFSFPLENLHKAPVTSVELNPKLVKKGQDLDKASSVHFISSDVEEFLKTAKICSEDLVILDPPRAGCSENTMRLLAEFQPHKIIYISCHPVSLARDLKWFFEWSAKLGKPAMKLKRVQAFEMFPQTDHVETIAELQVDS